MQNVPPFAWDLDANYTTVLIALPLKICIHTAGTIHLQTPGIPTNSEDDIRPGLSVGWCSPYTQRTLAMGKVRDKSLVQIFLWSTDPDNSIVLYQWYGARSRLPAIRVAQSARLPGIMCVLYQQDEKCAAPNVHWERRTLVSSVHIRVIFVTGARCRPSGNF